MLRLGCRFPSSLELVRFPALLVWTLKALRQFAGPMNWHPHKSSLVASLLSVSHAACPEASRPLRWRPLVDRTWLGCCVPAVRDCPTISQSAAAKFSLSFALSQPGFLTHRRAPSGEVRSTGIELTTHVACCRCSSPLPGPARGSASPADHLFFLSVLPSPSSFSLSHSAVEPSPLPQPPRVSSLAIPPRSVFPFCILFPSVTMASTRVLASRLASQMATKAARPAARVTLANTSKRTLTGE